MSVNNFPTKFLVNDACVMEGVAGIPEKKQQEYGAWQLAIRKV